MLKYLFSLFLLIPFVNADSTLIYEAQKKDIQLNKTDQEILEVGEISTARYITGGILGTYPFGLGIGHAIQGRWSQKGWIFTAGEVGSATLIFSGVLGCADNTFDSEKCSDVESALIITGVLGFLGFRIWEIIDVWAVPPSHNKKYNKLKDYIGKQPDKTIKASIDMAPIFTRYGQGLGLRINF